MTLEQVKNRIIRYGGKIVKNNDFRDLLNGDYYTNNLLEPTRILYDFSEINLPKEFYDSSYFICIDHENLDFFKNCAYAKKLILFLGSKDGVNLDYFYYIHPIGVDIDYLTNLIKKIKE